MSSVHSPRLSVRMLAGVLLAGVSLAACTTAPTPRLATRMPEAQSSGKAGPPSGAGGVYKVGKPYQVGGIWYVPREEPDYDVRGVASWYGDEFHNRRTANGEVFDMHSVSAAHTTLPLPSMVEVTNLENGRTLTVRVNDRGPFVGGRVIDLSHEAARQLGFDRQGLAQVRVRYVGPASLGGPDVRLTKAPMPSPAPATEFRTAMVAEAAPKAAPQTTAPISSRALPAITRTELAPLAPTRSAPSRLMEARRDLSIDEALDRSFWIQAGSFSEAANAARAAANLSNVGVRAKIEPFDSNGSTFYRVVLQSSGDEGAALALRDAVAQYGFADAKVVRPF